MPRPVKWAIGLGILLIFLYYQNNKIDVTHYSYTNAKLPQAFEGYKILHLSDLHNKSFGKDQKRLVKAIQASQADLIFITGDLIDANRTDLEAAMTLIHQIKTLAPIYYVPGNHESASGIYSQVRLQLQDAGVVLLENKKIPLSLGKDTLYLSGLMDPNFSRESPTDLLAYLNIKPHDFNILLSHRPEHLQAYADHGLDLAFAGHAHGGQFRLPFVGGLYAPGQGTLPKYTQGIHTLKDTSLVISRGLGNSQFPLRLFNQPELVLVTLELE